MSQSSKPLIPRLRCLATLLQQLNAQTACDAVNEAIESIESTEALRQSQSLPAGAVAACRHEAFQGRCVHCDIEFRNGQPAERTGRGLMMEHEAKHGPTIREALQADAREKGEAVFRLYPEELARMTHGPSLRAEEEDRLRSIYGDVAIPLYLHSGDYTEAMLLLEKQRELVENLRGQLDDAKADATDGCTEANCERCNTAIHSRGDMRHAGIGTYPATQPAQASEKDDEAEECSACDGVGGTGRLYGSADSTEPSVPCKTCGGTGEATHPQPVTPAGGEVVEGDAFARAAKAFSEHWDFDSSLRAAIAAAMPVGGCPAAWRSKDYQPWLNGGFAWAYTHNQCDVTPDHEPLYLHPPVADAALLRRVIDDNHACGHTTPETLNAIDAALNQRGGVDHG